MKKEQIFERIQNMSPEELSQLVCEALDESSISYDTGISEITFVKLAPLPDLFYFSLQSQEPKEEYRYKQCNAVRSSLILLSNCQNYSVAINLGVA